MELKGLFMKRTIAFHNPSMIGGRVSFIWTKQVAKQGLNSWIRNLLGKTYPPQKKETQQVKFVFHQTGRIESPLVRFSQRPSATREFVWASDFSEWGRAQGATQISVSFDLNYTLILLWMDEFLFFVENLGGFVNQGSAFLEALGE